MGPLARDLPHRPFLFHAVGDWEGTLKRIHEALASRAAAQRGPSFRF
jgi:hypothetical protein